VVAVNLSTTDMCSLTLLQVQEETVIDTILLWHLAGQAVQQMTQTSRLCLIAFMIQLNMYIL